MSDDYKRLTAFKTRVKDIVGSEMVAEKGQADYITIGKLKVSRVRIVGTIVNKRVNEERSYAFLVIDDGTETIRVKAWNEDVDKLEKPVIGDIIEMVGRVREWEGERYVTCEIIKVLNNPNHWLFHKYELLLSSEKVERITEKVETGETKQVEAEKTENEEVEDKILSVIKKEDAGRGVSLSIITKNTGIDEPGVKKMLKTLLNDGVIYEPTKLHYKFLEVD